jgi:hypothetical protein
MKVAYTVAVITILYVIASVGFILPFLISAASSILVAVGIAYIISMPVVLYGLYKVSSKAVQKEIEIENS